MEGRLYIKKNGGSTTWKEYFYPAGNKKFRTTQEIIGQDGRRQYIPMYLKFGEMLNYCMGAANYSSGLLSEIMDREHPNKDWSKPIIKCEWILSEVGVMIYDPKKRWAITQPGGFRVYPGMATPSAKGEVK